MSCYCTECFLPLHIGGLLEAGRQEGTVDAKTAGEVGKGFAAAVFRV